MNELKTYLDEKVAQFNAVNFIADDPILIPHQFDNPRDIETIGFIVATIAWGKRAMIIKNGRQLVDIMGNQPYEYVMNASENDLADIRFVHRTFNTTDLQFFIRAIRHINQTLDGGFEAAFLNGQTTRERIAGFRQYFLKTPHEKRSEKHLSNPIKGSAAKRINMFLRWMVRKDRKGVDFGIWNQIPMQDLYIPLDVHTGNVARKLGLITRKANDWKALEELMNNVRAFDPNDPCKYDFALFGIGVNNEI